MKYCAKCGTQMPDDAVACPQCHPETNKQQPQSLNQSTLTKNTSSKVIPLIITNFIISILALFVSIGLYFISPSSNNSTTNNNNWNSTCPANEYGHHDWSTPNCIKPAHCYECGEYLNDKLGEHYFETDDGLCSCWYCGILYEVYLDSLE